ncbi:MAG: FtsH protease activity modulator HflK [Candidatus Bipolaricaulota bacterium]|nr:FtsH protease activity modulator HflK [Candidatus Bipolaricaulota bacterium]MBS3791185.1 FtsH protease activity modulator HflK [Candidatus Bipolaricaulota bacterium]
MPDNYDFDPREERSNTDWDRLKSKFKRFGDKTGWIVIGLVVVIYLLQGIYQVGPAEVGLVKRFGKHVRTVNSGLNYHVPPPIESVKKVNVRAVRKIEIGYETVSPPPNPRYREDEAEALMLTGDDNIVHMELAVQFTVIDPELFAFNIIDPHSLVKEAAEAVIRQEVVKHEVEQALTTERAEIASNALDDLQRLLEMYEAGINIEAIKVQDAKPPEPVVPAFDDVTSAKEDKQTKINQAEAYANDVIPNARGQAAEIVNQAEATKAERVNEAEGDVSKFLQVLEEYNRGSQEVTRRRLYMETMEEILPGMDKVLLTQKTDGSSVLKLLNLNELDGGSQ